VENVTHVHIEAFMHDVIVCHDHLFLGNVSASDVFF
jgi:hypothetical protein